MATSEQRNRKPQAVFIAIVLAGVVGLGVRSLVSSQRSERELHSESTIRALSEVLQAQVDCSRTFEAVTDAPVDCGTYNPKPLRLIGKSGQPITGPLVPVSKNFDPTDSTFEGSGTLGRWELRTYCALPGNRLVVRYAKKDDAGEFIKDGATQRKWDWTNSDTNPLFGVSARELCTGKSQATQAAFSRLALLRLSFNVLNDGSEGITIDMSQLPPKVEGRSAELAGYTATEALSADSPTRVLLNLERINLVSAGNSVWTPEANVSTSHGKIQVKLKRDIKLGPPPGKRSGYGTVGFTVIAIQ